MPTVPTATPNKRATIELLGETGLRITRAFDAPRTKVFDAITKPEHVRQWYGPRALTVVLCESDLRVGGRWRNVLRSPDGMEHGFAGEYREIVRPELIVSTEYYEPIGPDHAFVATVRLEEVDGRTVLTNTIAYRSKADRDGHIGAGMEGGMNESFDRLEELLGAA
jgi:uncharacterized protein YndB with AHSA1/START domain